MFATLRIRREQSYSKERNGSKKRIERQAEDRAMGKIKTTSGKKGKFGRNDCQDKIQCETGAVHNMGK